MVEYTRKGNKLLYAYGFGNPIRENKKMKAKVEKTIKIDDGKHTGEIKELIYKDTPYNYVDVVIKEDKLDIDLKCGVPFSITENTALGQMLKRFGADLEEGQEIEVDDFLKVGSKVEFMTLTEKTKKGTFVRVLSESVKPVK